MGYRAPERTTALLTPAEDPHATHMEAQAPTPTLRHAPELPAATNPGPLTLNEQYVTIDRDRSLAPDEKQRARDVLTFRMVAPSSEDRARDQAIRNARAQTEASTDQYFTKIEQTPTITPESCLSAA